jgi:ankyrin repeat protein
MMGMLDAAVLLLEHKVKLDARDRDANTPLHRAVRGHPGRGHSEAHYMIVVALIRAGADVNPQNSDGESPLHIAASYGLAQVVELLIGNGAEIDVGVGHGLQDEESSEADDEDDYREPPINSGQTPLHLAAMRGHEEVVRILLDHGAEINARDDGDNTPLGPVLTFVTGFELFGDGAPPAMVRVAALLQSRGGVADVDW